jgi:hypothetical protein
MAPKRHRQDFTLVHKVWLLDYSDKHPGVNAVDLGKALADHINGQRADDQVPVLPPGKTTVNDWRRAAEQIREQFQKVTAGNDNAKRQRSARFPALEEALAIWFRQQEARDLPITDEVLRGQAKIFGQQFDLPPSFAFSDGWLDNFKKRQGIKQVLKHGEANDADEAGVQLAREAIPKIIADNRYAAEEIYKQDETGQFWRQVPQRSLATGKQAGRKKDKQRITASLCCNATGTDKRELFIIGKSKRPRSFPKNFQPERDWDIRYRNNSKAWMAADFSSWVNDWNSKLAGCAHAIASLWC